MRVLIASRGPSLATVVESAGHEVIDARPGDARGWGAHEPAPAGDAALIDLDDAELSRKVLLHLSEAQPQARLLVIRGSDPAWAQFGNPFDALFVTPPFTRDALLGALEHVGRDTAAPPEPEALLPKAEPVRHTVAPQPNDREIFECVSRLLASADDFLGLREIADTVAVLTADRVGADAVALALPDGPSWRVTGGHELRPVEGRMLIAAEHWLTADLLHAHRGVVIEHTDITRAQLRQAPLASKDYLVIATDRATQAILMAGRDSEPFTRDDLATLQHTLHEAMPSLREAMELRSLARHLERLTDPG